MRKKNTKKLRESAEVSYAVRTTEKASNKPENSLEKFMQTIRRLHRFQNVRFIIFHGSAAEGRALPESDIDICIYCEGTAEEQWAYRKELLKELPDVYDVQIFQQLPLQVRKEVLKGKPIYVKDQSFFQKIAEETINQYDILHPDQARHVREDASDLRTDLIFIKLKQAEETANVIEENLPKSYAGFEKIGLVKDGIYKKTENAIKNIIDACAVLNADLSLGAPSDTDDIIANLVKAKILSVETAEKIREMKAFRNVLVHKYEEIDDKLAYEDIKEGMRDIREIVEEIRGKILVINKRE